MPQDILAIVVLSLLFILFLLPNLVIVKENEAIVIERLGSFLKVVQTPSVFFLIPLVDRVVQKESLLEQTKVIKITSTNETLEIQWTFQIVDIQMYCYSATEPIKLCEKTIIDQYHSSLLEDETTKEQLLNYGVKSIKFEINNIN